MSDPKTLVFDTITRMLRQRDHDETVTLDARLTEDLRMDSLELAELSAILEDEFGTDPYSEGLAPETVGGIVEFFDP